MSASSAAPARPRIRVPAVMLPGLMKASRDPVDGSSYAAASQFNRDIGLWRPPLRSADAEILRDASLVRARARDLYRNHPYARQAVRTSRIGVIGKYLRLALRPDYRFLGIDMAEARRWAREFERVWDTYAHGAGWHVDAGRRMTFSRLMGLAHDLLFIDGEVLAAAEWAPARRWKSCFQLIDIDRLSNPNGAPDSAYLKGGIALDDHSAPLGYHIRNAHPGDIGLMPAGRSMTWSFVPRENDWGRTLVMHAFEPERAGQTRGISGFTTVIRAMKMGQEFGETELAAAVLQASYAMVITSQANYKEAMEIVDVELDENGNPVSNPLTDMALRHLEAVSAYHNEMQIRFAGLKIPHLVPGEDLKMVAPGQKATGYAEFMGHKVKEFSAGLGTDPIQTSQDYSDVNYSAARMSVASNYRQYELIRSNLIFGVAMPMVASFMEEVLHARALPMPKGLAESDLYEALPALAKGTFITAGAPMLDPVKERQGQTMGWTLGLDTLESMAGEEGDDWMELVDQKAVEITYMRERGVPLPGEPVLPPMSEAPADDETSKDKPKKKDA